MSKLLLVPLLQPHARHTRDQHERCSAIECVEHHSRECRRRRGRQHQQQHERQRPADAIEEGLLLGLQRVPVVDAGHPTRRSTDTELVACTGERARATIQRTPPALQANSHA